MGAIVGSRTQAPFEFSETYIPPPLPIFVAIIANDSTVQRCTGECAPAVKERWHGGVGGGLGLEAVRRLLVAKGGGLQADHDPVAGALLLRGALPRAAGGLSGGEAQQDGLLRQGGHLHGLLRELPLACSRWQISVKHV